MQNEDFFGVSQDGVCGGSLPLHVGVVQAARGVRHAGEEQDPRHHPPGPHIEIPVDLLRGILHGVLQDHV